MLNLLNIVSKHHLRDMVELLRKASIRKGSYLCGKKNARRGNAKGIHALCHLFSFAFIFVLVDCILLLISFTSIISVFTVVVNIWKPSNKNDEIFLMDIPQLLVKVFIIYLMCLDIFREILDWSIYYL